MSGPRICMVSDGAYTYAHPKALLFPRVMDEDPALKALYAGQPRGRWTSWESPYSAVVIREGETVILVDAGAGNLAPGTGLLPDNLKSLGISPDQVDMVVLTHLHPDHIAGLTTPGGDPVFARARILLSRQEHDFWASGPDLSCLTMPRESRRLICKTAEGFLTRYADILEPVPMDLSLSSHIRLFPAPGHTPGHMGVSVTADGKRYLVTGDAFLHPLHIRHPHWEAGVDFSPQSAVDTRCNILKTAGQGPCELLGFHLPKPWSIPGANSF